MEQFKRMTEDDLSVVSGGSKLQCAVTQAGGALAGFGAGTALGPWGSVAGFAIGYQYATSKYCWFMEKYIKKYGWVLSAIAVTAIWGRYVILENLVFPYKIVYTIIYLLYVVLLILKFTKFKRK